jgi:hypothetical protein
MAVKNGTAEKKNYFQPLSLAIFLVFSSQKYSKIQNNIRKMALPSEYLLF